MSARLISIEHSSDWDMELTLRRGNKPDLGKVVGRDSRCTRQLDQFAFKDNCYRRQIRNRDLGLGSGRLECLVHRVRRLLEGVCDGHSPVGGHAVVLILLSPQASYCPCGIDSPMLRLRCADRDGPRRRGFWSGIRGCLAGHERHGCHQACTVRMSCRGPIGKSLVETRGAEWCCDTGYRR